MRLIRIWPLALLTAGCAVTTPAPMLMHQERVVRSAPGAVSLSAYGGGGGGVFLDEFAGGGVNLDVQATDEIGLGIGGGGGREIGNGETEGSPDYILFGRVFGHYRPAHIDWVSLNFGLSGGGADTGLAWLTPDLGVTFGYTLDERFRPYAGVSFAVGVPIRKGPAIGNDENLSDRVYPQTTLHGIVGVGMAIRLVDSFEFSVQGSLDLGWAANDERTVAAALTWGLRYTFGEPYRWNPVMDGGEEQESLGVGWLD